MRGERVDIMLERTASFGGSIVTPAGMARRALTVELRSSLGPGRVLRSQTNVRGDRATYAFRDVQAGVYDFGVRVGGFDDPIVRIGGVRIDPGADELPARLVGIDLTDVLFRYGLRAVTAHGAPILDLASPLVAKISRPSGETQFVAFPWKNGAAEILCTTPQLELRLLGHGYRPRTQIVFPGETDVVFDATQPVELVLTGLREAVGDRRVRVSTVLGRDVELPLSLESYDQASGRTRGYSRANLGKAGGAWLGATDVVRVPLMHDGEYEVVVGIYEAGVPSPESRTMSKVPVRLHADTSPRIDVSLDLNGIRSALEKLAERKAAARNGR